MPAKFRAEAVFTITGKGLVVSGEILDGLARVGMTTRIPTWPDKLTISHVGMIRATDGDPANVGLLFASKDEEAFARWRTLDTRGRTLEIQDSVDDSCRDTWERRENPR